MRLACIVIFSFLSVALFSQKTYEAGLLLGGSSYQGDISPNTLDFSTGDIHPSLGLFFRYNANQFLSVRGSFNYGRISGDDADAEDDGRVRRNLSFQSNIFEFSVTGEFNIFGFQPDGLQKRFSPYLFGGIAVFRFNPETNYDGQLVALQPLGTEGQGMEGFDGPYRLTQVAIPMGAGIKFAISERINLGAEIGFRRTFTDYLDDVSGSYVNYNDLLRENGELAAALGNRTGELNPNDEPVIVATGTQRGNPEVDDWYAIAGLTISYTLYPSNGLGRRFGKKNDFGCPNF